MLLAQLLAGTLLVSPMDSPVRLGVSPAAATPTEFYSQRFRGFLFPCWNLGLCGPSCSPVVLPGLSACKCGTGVNQLQPCLLLGQKSTAKIVLLSAGWGYEVLEIVAFILGQNCLFHVASLQHTLCNSLLIKIKKCTSTIFFLAFTLKLHPQI